MTNTKLNDKQKILFGWIFILTGLPFILISLEIISVDESTVHAPLWVIGLCGCIFSLAGIMIVLGEHSKWNNLLAAILILSMGSVGAWVALFGASENFSGGIALLSDSANTSLARWMFGAGALICFIIALYAIRVHFRPKQK